MHVLDKINAFRKEHGVSPLQNWNGAENDHCYRHSLHMACRGEVCHAPARFLLHRLEAVSSYPYVGTLWDTLDKTLRLHFEPESAKLNVVLLPHLAYGLYKHYHIVYITVRGWN